MSDLGKKVQDESGASRPGTDAPQNDDRNAKTAGSDRDYDESQESKNQGHGHGAGGSSSEGAGRSDQRITEADRQERDLGGPGG
jgi:hypothetical protein